MLRKLNAGVGALAMRRRLWGALITATMLSFATHSAMAAPIEKGKAFALSGAQSKAIEAAVRDTLKDPDSARFSDFSAVVDAKGAIYACGFVNAKNSFGGYTGKQPFFGLFIRDNTAFFPLTIDRPEVTMRMCLEHGMFSAD